MMCESLEENTELTEKHRVKRIVPATTTLTVVGIASVLALGLSVTTLVMMTLEQEINQQHDTLKQIRKAYYGNGDLQFAEELSDNINFILMPQMDTLNYEETLKDLRKKNLALKKNFEQRSDWQPTMKNLPHFLPSLQFYKWTFT